MSNSPGKFTWNQDSVNNLVPAAAMQVVRPLLTLYGTQDVNATNIVGHSIGHSTQDKGSASSTPTNECLTPVMLSCASKLQQVHSRRTV